MEHWSDIPDFSIRILSGFAFVPKYPFGRNYKRISLCAPGHRIDLQASHPMFRPPPKVVGRNGNLPPFHLVPQQHGVRISGRIRTTQEPCPEKMEITAGKRGGRTSVIAFGIGTVTQTESTVDGCTLAH